MVITLNSSVAKLQGKMIILHVCTVSVVCLVSGQMAAGLAIEVGGLEGRWRLAWPKGYCDTESI